MVSPTRRYTCHGFWPIVLTGMLAMTVRAGYSPARVRRTRICCPIALREQEFINFRRSLVDTRKTGLFNMDSFLVDPLSPDPYYHYS